MQNIQYRSSDFRINKGKFRNVQRFHAWFTSCAIVAKPKREFYSDVEKKPTQNLHLRPSLTMMPVEPRCGPRCVIRDLTGWTGARAGDDRDEPGMTGNNRGSTGKVLKRLTPPGQTGNHRQRPATTGAAPATTETAPGTTGTTPYLYRGPYRPRQRYGNAPLVAGVAPVEPRWMPAESRYCYGTSVNRRSAGTPPANQHSPGLRLGITGDDIIYKCL